MTPVHTAATEVEALMLQGALEEAGIPVMLRSHRVPGYEQAIPPGWGDLLVPDHRAREARELVAAYLGAQPADDRP